MSGRGLPSWYKYRAYGPVYEEIRLAEHAVRLGSPVSFDRRGDVLFLDSFESGRGKWEDKVSASPGSIRVSADTARCGGLSAKFTGSALAPTQAGIVHYERYPVLSKLGFEASFTLETNLTYFYLYSYLFTGSTYQNFCVRYNLSARKLQYFDSGGSPVDLATNLDIYGFISLFHTMKLIVDPATGKYVRCVLDGTGYDMSGISCETDVSDEVPSWAVSVIADWETVDSRVIYVDDVILTRNEP